MKYRAIALVRFILFWIFYWTPLIKHGSYDNPRQVMGYIGWYSLGSTCLVFERGDGSKQYRW